MKFFNFTTLPIEEQRGYLPKWVGNGAIGAYFSALLIISVLFFSNASPWYFVLAGTVGIVAVFFYGNAISKSWCSAKLRSSQLYEKKLFTTALVIRLIYALLIYVVFEMVYGDPFGFENMDAGYYDGLGLTVASMIRDGDFHFYDRIVANSRIDLSDMGYGVYLGFVYVLTGNSVLVARLVKCLLSAFTVVLAYRIAARNFGEKIGRLAGVLCMLWPNFWYYCGCQLKETEMVFLTVLFVYEAEMMLRSRKFSVWRLFPSLIIIGVMFTFRTPLAVILILSLLFSVLMSSTKVVSWGKKVAVGFLAVSLIGVTMGNRIYEETQALVVENAGGMQQQKNMEWRSQRAGGNQYAKYAGAAVFAPMIFTIPFSTMVDIPDQSVQQLLNGGNFAKNVLSFFVILSMLIFLMGGDWRQHTLPLALMLGYLAVLALSTFAQSERFHQPAMPFAMMFAAYGIANCGKREKRWFNYWLVFVFVANIGWAWFKLKGRGMI